MMKQKVLIVDDDEINLMILQKVLEDHYEVLSADRGEKCLALVPDFRPDLVLLDIMMPGIDGYETCRRIKALPGGDLIHVMLVSAKASTKERLKGYEAGADDYVIKPFDHDELLAKVRLQFRLHEVLRELADAQGELERHNTQLEAIIRDRTHEVIATRDVTVFALARLAESRDPETGEHLERMRSYCMILARQLAEDSPYSSRIDKRFLDDLYRSSPLHDIGKVGIPDSILLKPGRLSDREFAIMKQHAVIGAEALAEAAHHTGSGGFLDMAVRIARYHHERWDGSGYAEGLAGEDIPLEARIVALADVYDALTSARVYKRAFSHEIARAMIEEEDGKHFDPTIVAAFRKCCDAFIEADEEQAAKEPVLAGAE